MPVHSKRSTKHAYLSCCSTAMVGTRVRRHWLSARARGLKKSGCGCKHRVAGVHTSRTILGAAAGGRTRNKCTKQPKQRRGLMRAPALATLGQECAGATSIWVSVRLLGTPLLGPRAPKDTRPRALLGDPPKRTIRLVAARAQAPRFFPRLPAPAHHKQHRRAQAS